MTGPVSQQSGSRGKGLIWFLVLAGVVLLLYAIGRNQSNGEPFDPFSISENGTQAMVRILDQAGADVEIRRGVPGADDDVALLLVDRYQANDPDEAEEFFPVQVEIREWVEAGGTLVVADPASSFLPAELSGFGIPGTACDIAALDGIVELDEELPATPFRLSADRQFCFGNGNEALVVKADRGSGSIVAFGLRDHLLNENIGDGDHGALAVALLAPTSDTNLVVLTGPTGAELQPTSLSDLIPSGVKWGLALAGLGFLLYALGRVPRHGRAVQEPQLVEIAGSELVVATGNMMARAHTYTSAAETLRAQTMRDFAVGLHMPKTSPRPHVIAQVAARLGETPDRLEQIMHRPIEDDRGLASLAAELDQVRHAVLGQPDHESPTTQDKPTRKNRERVDV